MEKDLLLSEINGLEQELSTKNIVQTILGVFAVIFLLGTFLCYGSVLIGIVFGLAHLAGESSRNKCKKALKSKRAHLNSLLQQEREAKEFDALHLDDMLEEQKANNFHNDELVMEALRIATAR